LAAEKESNGKFKEPGRFHIPAPNEVLSNSLFAAAATENNDDEDDPNAAIVAAFSSSAEIHHVYTPLFPM
jgi:hypothetical protein